MRAGIGGAINWVPRINRDRSQLCGFQPTFAQAPRQELTRTDAPEITIAAAPQAAPAPVAVTAVVTAPVRTANTARVGAPMVTVASTTTAPTIGMGASAQTGSPSPQIITIPAASQVATARVIPAAPALRVLTRAEICVGKTGVQPGYVSRSTGRPIDCGGQPTPTVTASVPTTMPSAGHVMTLSEICADASDSGRRYVSGVTGEPVRCGPQTQPLTTYTVRSAPVYVAPSAGPSRPAAIGGAAAPYAPSLTAPAQAPAIIIPATPSVPATGACGNPYMNAPPGMAVRCGPQSQSPSGLVLGSLDMGSVATVTRASEPVARYGLFRRRVPVSNPAAGTPAPAAPVAGYAPVWTDGRLNPNRGLQAPVVYVSYAVSAS